VTAGEVKRNNGRPHVVAPAAPRRAPKTATVTDEAIDKIRQLIISGEWGPGDRLPPEAELAARLGLSRNSLREAVRALSMVRVLEVRQGDGTYVSSLEAELLLESMRFVTYLLRDHTVIELFEVRRMLEPPAAALASVRMDDAGRQALKAQLERMIAAQAVEDLVEADAAFHALIAKASGNSVLSSLLQSLSSRTMRARLLRGRMGQQALEETRLEHTQIFEAVTGRDPELARIAAAAHVATGERWFRTTLGAE
jgi:GntR family transcriptional regulator, transcriptional repressor for pyruvate dehydrogenase complex